MLTYQQKKLTRTCLTVLAILGLLYGSAFLLFKIYFTTNHVQELLVDQAKKVLSRDVSVSDNITFKIDWDLSPHITLRDVTVSNAKWAKHSNMVKVAELDLHFSLTKLIFKEFHIISLTLIKPQINLETKGKENNWDIKNEEAQKGSNIKFSAHKLKIEKGILTYNDDTYIINKLNLKVTDNKSNYNLHLTGKYNNIPLKTTLDIVRTTEKTSLDIQNLELGSSTLKGTLKLDETSKKIDGTFDADTFVLDDFIGGEDTASGEYSLPNDKFPIAELKGKNFQLKVNINKLDLNGMIFSKVNLIANSNKNVLNFKLSPAAKFANGTIDFNLTYNLNYKSPQVKIQSQTNGVTLEGLLNSLYGKSPITGSDFKFVTDLNSNGDSMSSIVGNLNGKLLLTAAPGKFLNGTNTIGNVISTVLSSVISFDKTKSLTDFNCGVLNFRVNNGVANAKNAIAVEAASVNALGNGMVDLRNGRINFSLTPQNLITNPLELANFSLAQYVSVSGTLSKPKVSLDPGKLLTAQGAMVAQVATGIATGGASLLAGFLAGNASKATSSNGNLSPCKAAMQNN